MQNMFNCGCACNLGIEETSCEITFPGGHTFATACGGKGDSAIPEPRLALQFLRNQQGKDGLGPCEWCGGYGACGCEEALIERLTAYNKEVEDDGKSTGGPRLSGKEIAIPSCSRDDPAAIAFEATEKPDFTGKWSFTRTDATKEAWEALMVDAGVAWTTRKMAHGANYGIGLATHDIEQNGDKLIIKVSNGFTTTTVDIVVDGSEQETWAEDGNKIFMTPTWEGGVLKTVGRVKSSGKAIQPGIRYLNGKEMVITATASTGEKVSRFFEKK